MPPPRLPLWETAPEVVPLLEYEDDIAGGLMTPEFIALRETMNVRQALSSSEAVATLTDVLGFLVYLGLATVTIGLVVRSLRAVANRMHRIELDASC